MSGPIRPGAVPPDLPSEGPPDAPELPPDLSPEYAEAYLRGYERARQQGAGAAEAEHTARLESWDEALDPVPWHDSQQEPAYDGAEAGERRRLLAPLILVGLALLLVLGAYGAGRLLSSQVQDTDTAAPAADGEARGEDDTAAEAGPKRNDGPERQRYDGRVAAVPVDSATASCQSADSVDAAGHRVGYDPGNVADGDRSTAWRCDGDGVGQRITLDLPGTLTLGQVGMVPGYAKTDPRSGADRYAENNRVVRVRWSFSDGSSVVQRLDGSAGNRSLQTVRIPPTEADQVVIEILRSTPGPRNTVAVSEVLVGEAVG